MIFVSGRLRRLPDLLCLTSSTSTSPLPRCMPPSPPSLEFAIARWAWAELLSFLDVARPGGHCCPLLVTVQNTALRSHRLGFSEEDLWNLPYPGPEPCPKKKKKIQNQSSTKWYRWTIASPSQFWFFLPLYHSPYLNRTSPVAQMVKNLPTVQKTRVLSLGQEDPLEKGMAANFSILAWRIPWTEEPWAWWATAHGFTKSRTRLSDWSTLT